MPKTQTAIKYTFLAIFTFLFAVIVWPFLPAILFALIFSIVFFPLHQYLRKKLNFSKNLPAVLTVLASTILILIPLFILVGLIAKETIIFVQNFNPDQFADQIGSYSMLSVFGYEINLTSYFNGILEAIKNAGQAIGSYAIQVGSNIIRVIFLFFVFLFVYFYFLRDSEILITKLKKLLPFARLQNKKLMSEFNSVSKTVFIGMLVSALLSGFAAYIAFAVFGVPGALIWGLLAGLLSLIPAVGAAIIYLIGLVIVGVTSGFTGALFLLGYFVLIELVLLQSFIKPKLIDDKISVHPVLVFFALVGGVGVFGSIGILYGPIIVVLFASTVEFMLETQRRL
jgi:predicted PurR-regulated permease PerM